MRYWAEIDKIVCEIVNQRHDALKKYKLLEIDKTREIGNEGIAYWKQRIADFHKLSKREAVKLLIKAEKIEAKIKTTEKAISVEMPL